MSAPLSPTTMLSDGFKDAVIVVIGGSGGVGGEVVRQATELGACAIIGARSVDENANGAGPIKSGEIRQFPIDIVDPNSIRAFFESVGAVTDRIDILVNTAGGSRQMPLQDVELLTDEFVEEVMSVNARGPLAVIRESLSLLRAGRDPVIINLSSIAARTGLGSNMIYAASKAALDTMAISLAKALGPEIRVVNVSPTALKTGFAKGRPESFFDKTIEQTPLKRLASTDEVAAAVMAAARILTATTGVTIFVDGGRHL